MKRPFAIVSAGLLLSALPSFATSGGDSSVGGFCLAPDGRRILYVASEGGESGCNDSIYSLDVSSGRSTVVMACEFDEGADKRRQKVLQGCTPLVATSPSTLGLGATLRSRGGAPTFTSLPDDPRDSFLERATYPQRVELRRAGTVVGAHDLSSCLFSSKPKVARLTLFVAPQQPFAVLTVTHPGSCSESGYLRDELVLFPRLFGARGAPAPRPSSREELVALKRPDVEFSDVLLSAAKQLERAKRHAAAEQYRQTAEESRRFAVARALEAACLDADSGRFHAWGTGFEPEVGNTTRLKACQTSPCETRPVTCALLPSESLDALGVTASVRRAGPPRVPEPGTHVADFTVQCPQELVLSRNGARLAVHAFESACPSSAPARLVAWPVPQKKLIVFRLTPNGGWPQAPSEFFVIATPGLKPSVRKDVTEVQHWLPLDLPPVDRIQVLDDVGMALYRKGRFDDAARYFESAWAESWNRQPRLVIALSHQAAALARAGHADQSLSLLRQLLSFPAERERFVASVPTDDAFAALRTDARFIALLTEPDCCLETVSTKRPESTMVIRWRNGAAVLLHRLEFRNGAKVGEFDADAGFSRRWNETGDLLGEDLLVGGEKNGASRTWDDQGHLMTETTWAEGLKSGPARQWSPTGQLISETTYADGVMTGRQRTWYSSGKPKSDAQLVEGQIVGPNKTWNESEEPALDAGTVDGGVSPR